MSDHIPFDIQSQILQSLPVKSLVQFRSVSKQWKSFIEDPKFIKTYHINHTNPQHHLLLSYKLDTVKTYTSIIDNNTFPQQKFPLTAPESLSSFRNTFILDSVNGLVCFCCCYGSINSSIAMVVIWNPTIRKSVDIFIPLAKKADVVGFGVCPDTSDPKLVKISISHQPDMWDVEVFTLSTRIWKPLYTGAPFKLCYMWRFQVFIDGVIYFSAFYINHGRKLYFFISFNLKSEKFGEVCLPDTFVNKTLVKVAKVNESLSLLEYHRVGGTFVCDVWTRKDGANKTFTKIFTIKVEGKSMFERVLGFRKNGEVVMEMDGDFIEESRIEVYEPLPGHISGVGINGNRCSFSARSHMETLLLFDESDSIIH